DEATGSGRKRQTSITLADARFLLLIPVRILTMPPAQMGPRRMKTVLIIDDEPTYRKVTGELLRQNGWEVLLANEGDEGMRMAKAHRPQFILCDLLMPRCNGFQVCRALRADENLRHTRIVVTSGRDFGSDRHAAFAAG